MRCATGGGVAHGLPSHRHCDTGPGTIVGLAGDDQITVGTVPASVTGDSGNDNIALQTGNTGTVNSGTENDVIGSAFNIGSMQLFGGDGGDVISVGLTTANQTIVGGNDSNDGADNLSSGSGADLVFGNGGDDILLPGLGNDTTVGGFGIDTISDAGGSNFAFGNQGNDLFQFGGTSANTGYGGLGDDLIAAAGGPSLLFGNEGGDNIIVGAGATVVGGDNSADGNDMLGGINQNLVFGNGGDDQFAFGGIEIQVVFAANMGAGTGGTANNALAAADALNGGAAGDIVAAQFTFGGRTYLAIDQANGGAFDDTEDLLLDITGVTGTIATSNFI